MWLEQRSCNQVRAAQPVIQAFKLVVGKLKPRRQLGFATPFPSRSEQHLSFELHESYYFNDAWRDHDAVDK